MKEECFHNFIKAGKMTPTSNKSPLYCINNEIPQRRIKSVTRSSYCKSGPKPLRIHQSNIPQNISKSRNPPKLRKLETTLTKPYCILPGIPTTTTGNASFIPDLFPERDSHVHTNTDVVWVDDESKRFSASVFEDMLVKRNSRMKTMIYKLSQAKTAIEQNAPPKVPLRIKYGSTEQNLKRVIRRIKSIAGPKPVINLKAENKKRGYGKWYLRGHAA